MSNILKECIDRGYNVYVHYEKDEVTISWDKLYQPSSGSHMHILFQDFLANPDEYYRDILRWDDEYE
jgi:hypothetical protein